jgi:hypothetical protein
MVGGVLCSDVRVEIMTMTGETKSRGLRLTRSALVALIMLALPAASFGGVFISVGIAPPPLPVYAQPICPGPGYMWTPGYWAYGPADYYWVAGRWVVAPFVGALWTPGYWGWSGGVYAWHAGYWGTHVGFYGGVNYGFGYTGVGYAGGYWHNGVFAYNRAVNHLGGGNFHTYNRAVIEHETSRVSYNGGRGGLTARPAHAEEAAAHEHAGGGHAQRASANHAGHGNVSHSSSHATPHRSAPHAQSAHHASNGSHAARGRRA